MTQNEPAKQPQPTGGKAQAKVERLAREAAALRANLRKRKEQARAQAGAATQSKQD
ncbi:MAG TPA: hypothetical protein VGG99_22325 [Acetobacteraceae bacterium]|jgi:hypothetical protein